MLLYWRIDQFWKALIMPALFKQTSFLGGLDAKLDATKIADDAYPLLVNGRIRKGVVSPTSKHIALAGVPQGNYQGLYITGSFLLLFVSGIAYWSDVTAVPMIFYPVANWTSMDSTAKRIYAELVPATSNLFNRQGTPDSTTRIFNKSIAVFEQAIFCFDGSTTNNPQAVRPDGTAVDLGSYDTWTQDNPLYVPKGILPAFCSNKLFLAALDALSVLSSVSGRASDFVINLDNNGDKGGDADTVSQAVSFNPITAIRSLSTGEVLVGTLYGTYVLQLDYTNTQFGEPYELPVFLFPAGPINEISIVDILSDTAMITQSGIHAFNAVAQAKRTSNNFPLGAQIRAIITNPTTEKAIIQKDTCAAIYDDYAFFAVNTIYGYGALVYDTITQSFHSLDLSFGQVKQFASARINDTERFFFITADNVLYEAFADTKKNTTRILLGEWTPPEASDMTLMYMVNAMFTSVREPGQVKLSVYADRVLRSSAVLDVTIDKRDISLPISIPFVDGPQVAPVGFQFNKTRAWKMSAMLEWNFAGDLTDFSVTGTNETAENVRLTPPVVDNLDIASAEVFAFLADSGYSDQLNPTGVYNANGVVMVDVVLGSRYVFNPVSDGELANGPDIVKEGLFTAKSATLFIKGTPGQPITFDLRTAENYCQVLDAINAEPAVQQLIHGGDFAYPLGTQLDVIMARYPINRDICYLPGNHDVVTENGKYFFNLLQIPRYYSRSFRFVDMFFYNGEPFEPDGVNSTSLQAGVVKNWIVNSTRPFKILFCHQPPVTNDLAHYPGRADLLFLTQLPGLSAMVTGHAHNMERFDLSGFPLFTCGTGGSSLRGFVSPAQQIPAAFMNTGSYGYLLIESDALSCKLSFKDTHGTVLNSFSLHT